MSIKQSEGAKPLPPYFAEAFAKFKCDSTKKIYHDSYGPDYNWEPSLDVVESWLAQAAVYRIHPSYQEDDSDTFQAICKIAKQIEKEQAKAGDGADTCPICRAYGKPTINCDHLIRTQKAKGLTALRKLGAQMHTRILPIIGIMHQDCVLGSVQVPAFARPCPHRPRHGYIDSRVVESMPALTKLAKEVFEDDPQGEVMLTPVFSNVTHNAIWTPSLLTIGLGNDGATGGKNTVNVPLSGQIPENVRELLTVSKVGADEDPYIEAICAQGYTYLTQLRAGPKGAVVGNFIPKKIKVNRVIRTNGEDLLKWEALIKSIDGETGVVVYHPGGSPADHYSVHCRCTGVPVIYDFEPEVGSILKPTSTPELDPQEVINGAVIAAKMMTSDPDQLDRTGWAELMLFGFHASGGLSGVSSRLLGASVVSMIRLGMAALAGEARHCRTTNAHNLPLNRIEVWKGMDGKSLTELRARIDDLINIHLCGEFASGGFGGKKWAQCGVSLVPLFNGLRYLALAKTPEAQRAAINNLLMAHNIAVHQAHNGGWWMNKFVQQQAFDMLQLNDPMWVCAPKIIELIYEILSAEAPQTKRATGIWARWPRLVYSAPELKDVIITYDSTWDQLLIKTKFALYGGGNSSVTIPVPDKYRESLKSATLYAEVVGDNLIIKTDKEIVIINEPVLRPQGDCQMLSGDDDDDDDDLIDDLLDDLDDDE